MLLSLRQRLRERQWTGALRVLIVVIGMLLVGAGMAACVPGQGGTTTGGQPPSTPTLPAQGLKCGHVQLGGTQQGPLNGTAAKQAEDCFWRAYQQCHSATLTVTMMAVDAGATHSFTIAKANGNCTITDAVQTYVIPTNIRKSVTYTCGKLEQTSSGLVFSSCGALGTVTIPAPPPS